jgi:dTDP-glucose 4,6-dehydratase
MNGGTVLVTGAAGFIGSHLCERLLAEGADVRALARYTGRRDVGHLADLAHDAFIALDIHFGDLTDGDFVGRLMAGCEAVFHLGASISVPYSYVAPHEVVKTNVLGTLNVLSAARTTGSRVVQMSSSEVYGTALTAPMTEAHPLNAQSPYAASKVGADKLAEAFFLSYDLPVVIARPFNTYGPRQSPRAVLGTLVEQAVAGGAVELGSLGTTRDFVYVADTVDALLRLIDDGEPGEAYNVATGQDVSITDAVELVGELLGRPLDVTTREERMRPEASEVRRLCGDATKLREATGWAPAVELREGLMRMIQFSDDRPRRIRAGLYEI